MLMWTLPIERGGHLTVWVLYRTGHIESLFGCALQRFIALNLPLPRASALLCTLRLLRSRCSPNSPCSKISAYATLQSRRAQLLFAIFAFLCIRNSNRKQEPIACDLVSCFASDKRGYSDILEAASRFKSRKYHKYNYITDTGFFALPFGRTNILSTEILRFCALIGNHLPPHMRASDQLIATFSRAIYSAAELLKRLMLPFADYNSLLHNVCRLLNFPFPRFVSLTLLSRALDSPSVPLAVFHLLMFLIWSSRWLPRLQPPPRRRFRAQSEACLGVLLLVVDD
jgi:hypothetical protein